MKITQLRQREFRRSSITSHVLTVVPAHNEEELIGATIKSVKDAMQELPDGMTSEIVVVADRCTDRTAAEAEQALGVAGTVLDIDAGNVGAARQRGVRIALSRSCLDEAEIWVASTDGDTVVPTDWLAKQVAVAGRGYVGVAGVVELDPVSFVLPRFLRDYRDDMGATPSEARPFSHQHVHGANMGFSADAYGHAGGWRHLRTGEDHDLWQRLRQVGPVLSTTALTVRTSDRLVGRAPLGFARDLRALVATDSVPPGTADLVGAVVA